MLNVHPSSRIRKMLPGVSVIIAAYCHGSNEYNCAYWNNSRHHNSIPKRTPVTNTYIKTYEHVVLFDVASSLSQRPSRNATKQLRSLEQRVARHNCKKHTHTHSTRDQYASRCPSSLSQYIIAWRDEATAPFSNDKRHGATSASPMAVTHPPIYNSERLSNVASSLSQRPSRSATKKLRSLERCATSRLPERSPPLTYIL